jgi:hypothetical protein
MGYPIFELSLFCGDAVEVLTAVPIVVLGPICCRFYGFYP